MADRNDGPPTLTGEGGPAKGQSLEQHDSPHSKSPAANSRRTKARALDPAPRAEPPAPVCLSMMAAVERLRLARDIPMDRLSEFAGLAERAYSKSLYPDTSSGRQPRWETLQTILDVLAPDGIDITITPRTGPRLDAVRMRYELRYDKAMANHRTRRELLSEWGRRGGLKHSPQTMAAIGRRGARARSKTLPPEKRSELARRASAARWAKRRQSNSCEQNQGTRP